jgi:hypothetical protein
MQKEIIYATDIGPECSRCGATMWLYRPPAHPEYDSTWTAECAVCRQIVKFAGPQLTQELTIQEVRHYHIAA